MSFSPDSVIGRQGELRQVGGNSKLCVELLGGTKCLIRSLAPRKPSVVAVVPNGKLIYIPLLRAFCLLYSIWKQTIYLETKILNYVDKDIMLS